MINVAVAKPSYSALFDDQTGGLIVTGSDGLTDEQAYWLKALLESRPKRATGAPLKMPDDIRIALAAKGLVWWIRGRVEITLDGIRAIARRPPPED